MGQLQQSLVRQHILGSLHVHIHRVSKIKKETEIADVPNQFSSKNLKRSIGRPKTYLAGRRLKWAQRSSSKEGDWASGSPESLRRRRISLKASSLWRCSCCCCRLLPTAEALVLVVEFEGEEAESPAAASAALLLQLSVAESSIAIDDQSTFRSQFLYSTFIFMSWRASFT